jgi:hypothetical protein
VPRLSRRQHATPATGNTLGTVARVEVVDLNTIFISPTVACFEHPIDYSMDIFCKDCIYSLSVPDQRVHRYPAG